MTVPAEAARAVVAAVQALEGPALTPEAREALLRLGGGDARKILTSLEAAAAAQPPPGCAPGYTGITNGCAPFCVPGKFLNAQTGLCEVLPPPPPPRCR